MKQATCPKCNHELRLRDWREECPYCGVNMNYYKQEELLLQDADRAEIEFALFQPRIDRAKASFIGSPLAIIRLIGSLLPAAALLLPLAELRCTALLDGQSVSYTIVTLIEAVKSSRWESMFGAPPDGSVPFLLLLLGALLCLILHFVGILGGCTKKGKIFLFVMDAGMLALTAGAAVLLNGFIQRMCESLPHEIERFSMGYGVYVFIGLLAFVLLLDIVTAVHGIPVRRTQRYIADVPAEEYFAAHPEYITAISRG